MVEAKKHAAWLHFTFARTTWWFKRVAVSGPDGEVDFSDYEFKNGDSQKVK